MPRSGKVSAYLERIYLEPECQVTKDTKWQFPWSEEESETGGDLHLEAEASCVSSAHSSCRQKSVYSVFT